MKKAITVIVSTLGPFLTVAGVVGGVLLFNHWPSVELKVAAVGLGLAVASTGIGYIFAAISANDASNADQRLDEIEARLDGIERSIQAIDPHPAPKGWVRALFYETQQTETKAVTGTSLAHADSD